MASDSSDPGGDATGVPEARSFGRRARLIVVVVAVLVVSTMGGAAAAALITGRQIKDGTVTGRDIRDQSLRPRDARSGLVRAGRQGPEGAPGPDGPAGASGPAGRNGLGGLTTVVSPSAVAVPPNASVTAEIACPDGMTALGGGVGGANQTAVDHMVMTRSMPTAPLGGWSVGVFNFDASDIGVFLWVQCAAI